MLCCVLTTPSPVPVCPLPLNTLQASRQCPQEHALAALSQMPPVLGTGPHALKDTPVHRLVDVLAGCSVDLAWEQVGWEVSEQQ